MKTMDNVKRKIITSMVAILLLIITLFGITYAYFMANLKGNDKDKSVSVNSGMLKLTYDDGNGELTLGEYLLPGKTVKFKDSDGNIVTEKTFSVKNTGTYLVEDYEVVVENVVNDLVNYEDLIYTLTCRTDKENGTCNGSTGAFPKTYNILVTNSIDVNETQYYTLTMKFNETNKDQSIDMNKNVSARINIQDNESSLKDLVIYGNSVQDGTPSETNPVLIQSVGEKTKNLFDKSNYIIASDSVIMFDASELVIGETYTLSTDKPISWFQISNSSSGHNSVQYTNFTDGFTSFTFKMAKNSNIPDNEKQYVILGIDVGDNPNFIKDISLLNDYNIQIEKASTASDYEPYGYKIPIIITGKNLLNSEMVENVNQYIVSGNGTINLTPGSGVWRSSDFINVSGNSNYYFNSINSSATSAGIAWYDLEKNFISGVGSNLINQSNGILTSPDNAFYVRLSWRIDEGYNTDWESNLQLERGITATKYEPYSKTTYNIYLDEPLRKVGDAVDYVDFMNYKVVRNVNVNDDTGTKTIENSYSELAIPLHTSVKLPTLIKESVGNIEVDTTIQPSKIEY